ncbi:MAG: ankyrin repeat domain-containing protein [Phycisphaerales bacterium]
MKKGEWICMMLALTLLPGGCKKGPSGVQRSLHDAAVAGDLVGVQRLLSDGVDVNSRDREGYTALHHAARQAHQELVKLLIEKGAEVNVVAGAGGETPLHAAVVCVYRDPVVKVGEKSVVRLLAAAGADLNAADADGATPLHRATSLGNARAVKHLLAAGANANARDCRGETPLHKAVLCDSVELLERLLARGGDVNAANQDGWTPLHVAALYHCTRSYDFLMAHGADPDIKNSEGKGAADVARDVANLEAIMLPAPEDGPFAMIVTDPGNIARFLWWCGVDFDRIWVPDGNDVEWIGSALRAAFDTPAKLPVDAWFETEYVRTHLHRYNHQYAGFISKGRKCILSNMYLLNVMNEDMSADNAPSIREQWALHGNEFVRIFDGGAIAVRALFDVETRTLVHIESNGM